MPGQLTDLRLYPLQRNRGIIGEGVRDIGTEPACRVSNIYLTLARRYDISGR
jgi:hypothetical protein